MSDPGSDRSNRNGHSGKDGMAYGGLAYYDNPLFTHSYKGSFSENPDCHRHESGIYRPKKSRCLVAVIIIGLLLVVGIAVSLGVYFGVMEKTDKVGQVLSTEPVTTTLQPPTTTTQPPATTTQAPVTTTQPPVTTTPAEIKSRIFEITFRFDIPWKSEYKNGTGYMMLTTKISDQLNLMVYNSTAKDVVDYIQIIDVRQGSVLVTIVIGFNQYLTPDDVRQTTINLVKAVQEQPPSSSNDLIQKIDLSYIMVSEHRDGPMTTTSPPIAEDCHSVSYIKQFVTNQCDSARNQLTKVENSKQCSVFLDLVGCVVFQSQKCSIDEVIMTLNKDLWGIIGQNITGFDPATCYGSGSQIVLPTIMPLNTTLKPCIHPDVLSYVLKYDCYYTALEQQMNGDTELESCRFYWYSSSCVYGALKDNAMMGNCSYQEIAQVLQMYENQLYMISPNNVNASVCFDYDRSTERCSTFLYDPYSYHYFYDCYSSGYINRNNWALDVSSVGCMIYEESYECMYRFYKQEGLGSCDTMQFEEDVIWLTNSMNDIMSQSTVTPPDSKDTVKMCIANVSHTPDFGQDLCEDGTGLIMADTVCLIYLQYSPDKCSGIKTTYLPCLLRKTVDYRMACSEDIVYASIMKESDLILKLTMNMVDISKCDQDEDKVGECPSVRNDTGGICLQNCTYDKECAGNQKCCSNGCGHMCVEPASKVFKMTLRFNITWDSDYGDENSTKHAALTADILNQVNTMVTNSQVKDLVEWLKIIGIREGSVYVDFLISFIIELTADDVQQMTVMLVQTVQANPTSPLDKIKSINTDDIHVTIYKGTETGTDDDDDCSDYNRITTEFMTCSVYLIRFIDMSDSDLDKCGLYNYFIDCVINTVSDVGKTCRENSLRKWMPTALVNMVNPALEELKNCPGYVDGVCKDEPIIQHIFMTACNYTLDYIATRTCQVIQETVSFCMLPSMPGSRCTGDQIGSTLLKSSQIKNRLPDDFDPTSCGYSGIERPGSCPAVTTVGDCVENCTSDTVGDCVENCTSDTVGDCVENCTSDSNCTGGQKCCFNGCVHVCMDPVSNMFAERFQITFRINITWTEAYRNKNSTEYVTLQTNLENQLDQMLSNSIFKDIFEYIKVIEFRPGSVMAVCELKLTEGKPLNDVKSGTRQIILQEQQKDPSPDNLLQAVDPDDIHVITQPGDVCTDVETFRTIATTTCKPQIDQFSSSDNLNTFCQKLNNLDACIKGALPAYECPNEIAAETYFKLFGLLDQLLGFSASSMAIQCSS